MPRCQTCWRNGRALDVAECLCNGKVLNSSQFYAQMGKKLVPLPEKTQDAPKREEMVFKPVLRFGETPEKPTRRNDQAK